MAEPIPIEETPIIPESSVTEERVITDYIVAKKLVQLKQSAESRGKVFSLSFSTVKRLLTTKKCFYTGVEFGPNDTPQGRTIDRVDTDKGYIEGNVVACTFEINQKKANLSTNEIFLLNKKLQFHKKIQQKRKTKILL